MRAITIDAANMTLRINGYKLLIVFTISAPPVWEIEDYIMAFCLENGTEAQLYDDKQNDIYCVDLSKSLLIKDATIGQVISWDFMNSNKLYRLDISISHRSEERRVGKEC